MFSQADLRLSILASQHPYPDGQLLEFLESILFVE